jgi:hypothetical protein
MMDATETDPDNIEPDDDAPAAEEESREKFEILEDYDDAMKGTGEWEIGRFLLEVAIDIRDAIDNHNNTLIWHGQQKAKAPDAE